MLNKLRKKELTVVLVNYNREQYIEEAILSILNQSYENFEFLIIDNCSTDSSLEIIKKYAVKDKRIKLKINSVAQSTSYNLKQSVLLSNSNFIAIMDDDNISFYNRLEKQISYMKRNKNVAVLGSKIEFIGESYLSKNYIKDLTDTNKIKFWFNFYNPFVMSSIMINKKLLYKYNINFKATLPYIYDYYFMSEVILNYLQVEIFPDVLLRYRGHKEQLSNNSNYMKNRKYSIMDIQYGLLKRFFENNDELYYVKKLFDGFPFENYNPVKVIEGLKIIKEKNYKYRYLDDSIINELIKNPFIESF